MAEDDLAAPLFSLDSIKHAGTYALQLIIRFIQEKLWPSKELIIIILLSVNIFIISYHICAKIDQSLPEEFFQNLYKSHSCSFSSLFDWPLKELTWEKLIQKLNFTAN